MDRNTKILLGIIIILVALTSLMAGFLLQSYLINVNSVVNNTTTSVSNSTNSSVSTQTQSESVSTGISVDEAISIARNIHPEWYNYRAEAVYYENVHRYDVQFYDDYNGQIGDVIIEADTGEVIVPD